MSRSRGQVCPGDVRSASARSYVGSRVAVLMIGLAISALMASRSQVTIDQLNLLARGWHLAALGEWVPYGVWATGGGYHPGGMTSLVVGLPLLLWENHRSPVVLILASHLVGYLFLHVTLRRILSPLEQLLFGVLYWLSPWRLFFSGFLWNPNLLFFFGAAHLWSAHRLRRRPSFWISFAHVLGLGLAVQLHISALLLAVSSLLLWSRRYLRLHLGAVVAATVVVALSLVPWAFAMQEDPSRLPVSRSQVGHGLLGVTPILQGVVHWLRFAAAGLNRSMATLDFSSLGGPGFDVLALPGLASRGVISASTVLLALWANWRLWRTAGRPFSVFDSSRSERHWLEGAIRWSFVGALVVFALSPVGVSGHGLLSIVHLAVLPVVLAVGSLATTHSGRLIPVGIGAYAALMVVLGVGLALGSPAYRCGGARNLCAHFATPPLVGDHPMFDDLGIRRSCELVVDDPQGWWPDGLEPAGESGSESLRQHVENEPGSRPSTVGRGI